MANNLIQKATAQAAVKQDSGKTTMQAYIRQIGTVKKSRALKHTKCYGCEICRRSGA